MRRFLLAATSSVALLLPVGAVAVPAAAAEPAPPVGTVTDFGVQSTALTVFEGHLGTDAAGQPAWYGVQMGTPGVVAMVDPVNRTHRATFELPDSSGGWGITQSDDGTVYAGSYPNAHVYRIDPATSAVTDLGAPVAGQTVLYGFRPGRDGRIYGGTYPGSHVFSYSPTEGFRDYGSMYPGQHYAIDVAVDPDREVLWAAVGTGGHLIRLDLRTGEKRDIWPAELQGDVNHPYDINLVGGRLFVKRSKLQALVLDPDTGAVLADNFTISSRGISGLAPDGRTVYFTSGTSLWHYDLATDTLGPVRDAGGAEVRSGGPGVGFGFLDGRLHALIGNYFGDALWYDPTTGANERFKLPFPHQPIDINNITTAPDGRVYTNLYINGNLSALDPATGTATNLGRIGQADGFGWHDGIMYQGVYPNASVHAYDPNKPFRAGTNPRELFRLQADHGQNRPVAFADAGTAMYIGSTPDYGMFGGALTRYDYTTGQHTVQRDIVPDQGVISLAVVGDTLWGGSSINGGGGTTPRATEARLFTVDLDTGAVTDRGVPVPGASSVTSLAAGPDGRLWGLADNTLFVVDPISGALVRRVTLPGRYGGVQDDLFVNPDEHVYVSLDGYLLRVDPLSYAVTVLRDAGTYRLTQDRQGNLWFRSGAKGNNNAVQYGARLLRYAPPADACPGSDLRVTVIVDGVDSEVANRYRPDGCTVNDLIREQDHATHEALMEHVTAVTRALVDAGILTHTDRAAIISAAARSDG
ncbi:hypothetical protein [Micromonospora echinaurantiaca]|uniref:hypothetical protein n=1 Tax=Micromonospora echinaurantiaca TaxID=47857 RepID=UPI0037956E2C